MPPSRQAKYAWAVDRHRDAILAIVAEHHALNPRIFGSMARGEATTGSDVDLLVDFTDEASLLDEVGLRLALQNLLEAEVDVVGADSLHGDVGERSLHEAIPL